MASNVRILVKELLSSLQATSTTGPATVANQSIRLLDLLRITGQQRRANITCGAISDNTHIQCGPIR